MTVFYHFDLITGGLYFRQDMGRKHNCPFSVIQASSFTGIANRSSSLVWRPVAAAHKMPFLCNWAMALTVLSGTWYRE